MHSYMLVDRWLHRDDSLPRHMRTVLLIGFDFSMLSKYSNLLTSSRHVSRRNERQSNAVQTTTCNHCHYIHLVLSFDCNHDCLIPRLPDRRDLLKSHELVFL